MKQILFVCTGNTCRSCMAEAVFNHIVSNDDGLSGNFSASSSGIAAFEGDTASENAISVMKKRMGIDLSNHRARKVDKEQIEKADLILTMTKSQKNALISIYSEAAGKVFTLKEFAAESKCEDGSEPENHTDVNDNDTDIVDPFGMPIEVYESCAEEIEKAVRSLISRLKSDI